MYPRNRDLILIIRHKETTKFIGLQGILIKVCVALTHGSTLIIIDRLKSLPLS